MATTMHFGADVFSNLHGSGGHSASDTFTRLLAEASAAFDSDRDAAKAWIARAAAMLQAAPDRETVEPDGQCGSLRGGLAPWQTRRVAAYVERHLGATIRVTDLAAAVQLSTSHFFRAFRETFGEAPGAYVARKRMYRAQQIMLTSAQSLSQIALACGLCDQAHFTRVFQRIVGMSPGAWRRQFAHERARPGDGKPSLLLSDVGPA